jgi:Enoyl-(Acyl carrier protein) reductase
MPRGGLQTSLVSMVNMLAAPFRRRTSTGPRRGASAGRGAPRCRAPIAGPASLTTHGALNAARSNDPTKGIGPNSARTGDERAHVGGQLTRGARGYKINWGTTPCAVIVYLDVNLKGSCFCTQAVAKTMVAAGRQGSIINIASGAALRGSPRGVHYVASKGGVLSLTRAMALELAPHRIRVNAIAPGLTDTAQPRYGSSEAEIAEMARAIPLGRMAQPDEIARAAVFLASENAGFVTGQTLHVNGGSYLA